MLNSLRIDGIEVPGEVVKKMERLVGVRLKRKPGEKELAEFIANLLQEWAYNMDRLVEKGGMEK